MADKIDLSRWDALSKWTQRYYRRSIRSKITDNNNGTFTCIVDFSAWESAEGVGTSKAAAKKAAADAAWAKIESGEFIGDDFDVEIFEAWQAGNEHSAAESMMRYINRTAAELPDDDEE